MNPKCLVNNSFIWKGLLLSWNIITKFLKWALGDGKLARFWLDLWASSLTTPLASLIHSPFVSNDLSLTIKSVLHNGCWNLSSLSY